MAQETKSRNNCPAPAVAEQSHEAVLNPEVREAIKGLRPEQRKVVIQAIRQESFSGPIPHPELLQKYDEVKPGFAERIISMAERQLDHRINCEDKVVDDYSEAQSRFIKAMEELSLILPQGDGEK